jgi:hypothetical protein
MNVIKVLILALIFGFFFVPSNTIAQQEPSKDIVNDEHLWSIRMEVYSPKPLVSNSNSSNNGYYFPRNWGVSAGAERTWQSSKRWRKYQTALLGFYNDVYFERVLTLETGYGIQFKPWKGIYLGSELNVGYNYARSSHLISIYENNRWISKVDNSVVTHRFTTGLAFQLGYDLGVHFDNKIPLKLFVAYSAQFITPYDKLTGIPFFIYHQPRVGFTWRF